MIKDTIVNGCDNAPHRSLYNALGLTAEELQKPLIGIVCSYNEIVPGHTYRAAFSADWPEERKLRIRVQIIDKYFGNLGIVFGFRDEKNVSVRMVKNAENFLDEYKGTMNAHA